MRDSHCFIHTLRGGDGSGAMEDSTNSARKSEPAVIDFSCAIDYNTREEISAVKARGKGVYMLCQICGRREGVPKIIIQGNVRRTVCICRECEAKQLHAQYIAHTPFVASCAPVSETPPVSQSYGGYRPLLRCPQCGWTTDDFERTQLFGCERCYEVFEPVLRDVLRRCQPSCVHVGKSPDGDSRGGEYEYLREQIDRAVADRRFGDAEAFQRLLDGLKEGK